MVSDKHNFCVKVHRRYIHSDMLSFVHVNIYRVCYTFFFVYRRCWFNFPFLTTRLLYSVPVFCWSKFLSISKKRHRRERQRMEFNIRPNPRCIYIDINSFFMPNKFYLKGTLPSCIPNWYLVLVAAEAWMNRFEEDNEKNEDSTSPW